MQNELKNLDSDNAIIAHKTTGNLEGKGVNRLILDWYRSELGEWTPKNVSLAFGG